MSTPEGEPEDEEAKRRDSYADYVLETVSAFLNEKQPDVVCPIDGSTTWSVQIPAELTVRAPSRRDSVYLLVPLFCNGCGYALFFHPRIMGLKEEGEFW